MALTPAQHRLLEAAARNPGVAAAHHIVFHSVPVGGAVAPMTSTTAPVSGRILGPTSMRHSPMTHEVAKNYLVRALRGG
jgi:hypothetical protein